MPQELMTFQQQFKQLFQQGLALQQQKKWDDAISKYQSILDEGTNALTSEQAAAVYHNLSVISFEKSDLLKSYIWSKKSLSLNSDNVLVKNLFSEINKKFQPPQIPHQISTIETIQKVTLKNVSFDFLLIGFLVFAVLSLSLALKAVLARKKKQIESESISAEKKSSVNVLFGLIGSLFLTAIFIFFTTIKWSDLSIPKAIITVDNTSVETASGGNQASIFNASAGLEVDVLKVEPEYVQVRYPGAFSGWVSKKNLEILSTATWLQ